MDAGAYPVAVPLTDSWTRRLAGILVGSLVVPVVVEFILAMIRGEAYNVGRAAAIVGSVGVISLMLYVTKPDILTFRLGTAA